MGAGSDAFYSDKLPNLLTHLADRARVASIESSSAIEGIVVADRNRASDITAGRSIQLRDRSEQELAGYKAALDYLYQSNWQPLNVGLILHLHRLLFQFTESPGGQFKPTDNLVVDRLPDGSVIKRFVPVSAARTPDATAELISRYLAATEQHRHHPILLIGLFVLDLLTIHPFADGNGRVARALTNALLEQAGYRVSRFMSFEEAISLNADEYYSSLLASTNEWHELEHDPWPWLSFFVRLISDLYERFSEQVERARSGSSKQERVRTYILAHAGASFRLTDIKAALPGVSEPTIRIVLNQLRDDGIIEPDARGRGALWTKRNG